MNPKTGFGVLVEEMSFPLLAQKCEAVFGCGKMITRVLHAERIAEEELSYSKTVAPCCVRISEP